MNLNSNGFHRLGWVSFIVFTLLLWIPIVHADNSTIDYYSNNPVCWKYGINCNSYQLRKDILKPNQTLSDILTAYNVNPTIVHKVAQKAKQIFDVRKMKAGNSFAVMIEPDLKDTARYFIYEKNLIDYVVYNLNDPFDVYQGQKRIETRQNIAAGTVRSSLRKSFMNIGLDTDLLTPLSQIYSWTIDFHHLKKGDHFVIIFEENYVEDKSLGLNKIVAARFNHNGEDYYAFYYKDQGCEEYYDENGQSLQRTFLKAPLRYTKVTSRPSSSRLHPILKVRRPHLGTDYAAPHGTPIHTIGDGVVQDAGYHKGLGKNLMIVHSSIYKSQYLHLSKFAKGIRPGVKVKRGDIIGYVGSTGLATGPHLDFRFWKNEKISSHIDANGSEVETLEGKLLISFQNRILSLKNHLNAPPINQEMFVVEYNF